ncbi:20183_t:CDS:10, partial [Entrophospora sp. SA101]
WELSRILYFQEFDEVGYLASDLMDWLNICDPFRVSPDQEFINFEEYNPEHHEDPYFWKCVFRIADRPRIKNGIKTNQDFIGYWQEWKNHNVTKLIKILCGETEAILQCCKFWQEAFVCCMYHFGQDYDITNIPSIVIKCLKKYPIDPNSLIDNALFKLLLGEIIPGLGYCELIDSWLAAHLADILSKFNIIPKNKISAFSTELREYYLLNYAELLIHNQVLWQLGFEYLDHCEMLGESYLSELIVKVPIDSERKAAKLLNICKAKNLKAEARIILKVMGKKCLKNQRYSSSILYLMQAGETEKEYEHAGKELIQLIKSQVAPKAYWPALLVNAIPLLKLDIHEIWRILQEIIGPLQPIECLLTIQKIMKWHNQTNEYETLDEELSIIPYLCTKNISRL